MMRFAQSVPHDTTVLDAWREQVTVAAQAPWLARELVRRGDALLPQFASWYTYLRRLPRRTRRALQRRVALSLGGIALLFALGQGPAQAALIEVDGGCTLVDAITAANTDTATGGCAAGNGADTLRLEPPGRTVTLTQVDNDANGPNGLPVITSDVTISGQGGTIERSDSAPDFRILAVRRGGALTLEHTALRGGRPFLRGSGSGIDADGCESLAITDSTITNNVGIGIYSGDCDSVAIANSTISGNTNIGVVIDYGADLTISNSVIRDNQGGGVIIDENGGATIVNTTISGNTALAGLGVFDTRVMVINSTITGNTSDFSGGGIRGTYNAITVINSTISGNTTAGRGGGISTDYTDLNIVHSTITGNTAGEDGGGVEWLGYDFKSFTMSHSLVSGNTAPGPGTEISISPENGPVEADAFNIFGFDNRAGVVGITPGASDIVPAAGVNISDILNPNLASNGGPTQTHALVPGSPAIDAGNAACTDADGNPLLTDQRGEVRPVDGNSDGQAACDIGSFELQGTRLQRAVINFEGMPAGTVVTEVFTDGGFGPIKVRGKQDNSCPHNAAVVFDSSCPDGVCSGGDQDLGTPNETLSGPGQGKGGEVDSRWANNEPLGNLLIVHEACNELSDGVVKQPDDTAGASTIILKFPQPVRVFSYTIIDNERDERDKVNLFGKQGERLTTLTTPATGNNGKAVVQTTSDGTGIGGVIRMVFDRKGSGGIDNIVFVPDGPHELGWARR